MTTGERDERCLTHRESVSLREYFDARLAAQDRATEIARLAMEKRLDGMNEFREALKDQSNRNVTKAEYDDCVRRILADVRELRESRAELAGKASQSSVDRALVISLSGLGLAILSVILRLIGN